MRAQPEEQPPVPPAGGLTYAQGPGVTYGKFFSSFLMFSKILFCEDVRT